MPRTHFTSRRAAGKSPLAAHEPFAPTRAPAWQEKGLCRQTDPEIFFPLKGESSEPAKSICRACPVVDTCKEWAIARDELFGVWGALSAADRKRLRPETDRQRSARERADRIVEAGVKECPRCAETKPLGDYPKDSKSLTGHGATCKTCRAALQARGWRRRRQGQVPVRAESPQAIRRRPARSVA